MQNDRTVLRDAETRLRNIHRHQWHLLRNRMLRKGRLFPKLALPQTMDEKFLWRKLLDHDPRFVIMSDKLATKRWLAARWPELPVASVLWTSRTGRDLPYDLCAPGVVLKYNCGSHTNLVLGSDVPARKHLVGRLRSWLRTDYGWETGEWGYSPVRRRVFAEANAFPGRPVSEIKAYMQGGFLDRLVMIYQDGPKKTAAIWQDHGQGLELTQATAAVSPIRDTRPLPEVAARACRIARMIGAEFDHVRVDFMTDLQDLVVGEMTIYNLGGRVSDLGHLRDVRMNRHWDLRRSWFLNSYHTGWKQRYAAALRAQLDRQAENDPVMAEVATLPRSVFDICYDDYAPE